MILLGTDIVKVSRIKALGDGEKKKLFQPNEIGRSDESLAGIFAAKEAVKKALGTDVDWLDIEVRKESDGKPTIHLHNEEGIKEKIVSISHDGDYAIATVVIVK